MSLLLTNARIVSMENNASGYQVKQQHFIAVANGKIAQIGSMDDCPTTQFDQTFDCNDKLITPGFIDCHTHLVFAGNRANEFVQRLADVSYEEIAHQGGGIMATVNATRHASETELLESALRRLYGLIRDGVTTVEIKSGYGLSLASELKILRVAKQLEQHVCVKVSTTLLAAHAVPPEFKDDPDRYIDHVCNCIIPAAVEAGLVDYVDVFCEGIGFNLAQTQAVFTAALSHGLGIKGHTEQLSNLGGGALAASMGATSVDHLEYLDEAGVKVLAQYGTVATLLPGAFYFLRETQRPPVALLRHYQVPIALATDCNPGTSPITSLATVMNMGCTLFNLTPEEALRGVTCHAAAALGLGERRGQIKVGFEADLALWNITQPTQIAYEIGTPLLYARMLDGKFCYD